MTVESKDLLTPPSYYANGYCGGMTTIVSVVRKKYIQRQQTAAILFFAMFLLVGMAWVSDYGATVDEPIQRTRSLVSYKYINRMILHREVPGMQDIPDLEEFDHRYYGTFVQMPMVMVEDFHGFELPLRDVFHMRHVFTFLVVYLGYVCLYLALRRIMGMKSWTPLLTVMMLSLYPRFFAYQFFDIKNMMFAGLSCITIWALVRAVEKRTILPHIGFGMLAAITTNCRVMGILYPAVLFGYYIVFDIWTAVRSFNEKQKDVSPGRIVRKYLAVLLSFAFTWYAITPYAWFSPVSSFIGTFSGFAKYEQWNGTMVFMGKLITADEVPWYYLFVWFGITIPVMYLALFLIGNVVSIVKIIRSRPFFKSLLTEHRWKAFFFLCFWGSVGSVILLHSRIYIGWHHMCFAFIPMCVLAGMGLESMAKKKIARVMTGALLLTLTANTIWTVYYHPHESSFFNLIGKPLAGNFDREEWRTTEFQAMQWIATRAGEPVTLGGEVYCHVSLPEDQQEKLILTELKDSPDYIIDGYRNVIGNDLRYDGYEEVHTYSVDGYKVCSVFKKIEDE